ncbi:hypothetical protein K0U27_07960 [archaeon]|nr:hypothetical protein [archaeon]
MTSKKGIVVTVTILAAITGASFLLWIIPQDYEATFVVSDYEGYLNGVQNIHEVLEGSIDIEYQNLRAGEITPEKYIAITEVTSSQVTAQISEFVTSKPPEEWQPSYIRYMDAMKKFNAYILETRVMADLIEKESTEDDIGEISKKIDSIKMEYAELVEISHQSRPK